uniref:Zinc finger, AN1-type domain 6 n=1 Tax=Cyprinus carpio TaxID=7962 RepID=A0A8C1PEC7_CYPCA
MAQETNQTQVPLLCSNGCGFYGNPRNNGMCCVCYKDSLQRQKNTKSGRSIDSGESDVLQKDPFHTVLLDILLGTMHSYTYHTHILISHPSCFCLTGFGCRCGHLFCSVHRYSDVHNCSFDYKADAAEKIRKENPLIVGEKIKKI